MPDKGDGDGVSCAVVGGGRERGVGGLFDNHTLYGVKFTIIMAIVFMQSAKHRGRLSKLFGDHSHGQQTAHASLIHDTDPVCAVMKSVNRVTDNAFHY